jgi:hypothetical protein
MRAAPAGRGAPPASSRILLRARPLITRRSDIFFFAELDFGI